MVIDSRMDLWLNQSWWDRGRIYLGFLNFHCLAPGHEWEKIYICFLYSHLWAWWPQTRANLKKTGPRSGNSDCLLRGLFPTFPKAANPWAATGIIIICFLHYTGAIGVQTCEMLFSQYSVSLFYLGIESTLLVFFCFSEFLKKQQTRCVLFLVTPSHTDLVLRALDLAEQQRFLSSPHYSHSIITPEFFGFVHKRFFFFFP